MKSLRLSLSLLAGFLCAFAAQAAFPEAPIKLVVGFPPGGGGDLYGRLIANAMGKALAQTVTVENRTGAGGVIAADAVAKAKPDGYTLLLAMTGNMATAPAMKSASLPYKSPDDFEPIGLILEAPHGLFVISHSRFIQATELLKAAKTQRLSFASTGTGGAAHIVMEMLKQRAGVDILHIPYRGSGPAITDMLGGQVDMFFATAPPLFGQVKQGQLRVLATTGIKRSQALSDVPTFKELGVDLVATQWYGLAAPTGTPAAVIKILSDSLRKALSQPDVQQSIRKDGATERFLLPQEFRHYIDEDIARYREANTPELMRQITP